LVQFPPRYDISVVSETTLPLSRSLSSATRSLALEPLAHRHRRLSVARVAGASTPHAAPPPLPLASSPPFHVAIHRRLSLFKISFLLQRLDLKRGCSTFLRVAGISGGWI
uniref:Uncharacterized protein n=2 Tax=Aegilops tauschii subsp. strangulata TaxID=200361 RepID=A0A453R4Z5_AEGTS